jgi:iron(III) transport system permease protein
MRPLSFPTHLPAWPRLLEWGLLLVFLLVTWGPLFSLLTDTLGFVLADPARAFDLASLSSRRLGLLAQSVGLAAAVAATVMTLGVLAGLFAWQRRTGAGRHLFWAALLLVPLPPTVHALAWSALLSATGLLPGLIASQHAIQPWLLAWGVESMALLPLGISLSVVAFELVDPDRVQAARLLSPDLGVLSRILLPLASPLLLAGAGFLCVLCLTDYTIPSIFAANVYPFEIFAEFSTSYLPAAAVLLALPLLLVTIALVLLSQRPLRSVVQNSVWTRREWTPAFSWPGWFAAAQRAAAAVFLLQAGLVIAVLLALAAGSPDLAGTLALSREDAVTTVLICLGATALAVPVALALSARLVRTGAIAGLWWLLVVLPFAVPSPLVGIGMILFWNAPGAVPLYGTLAMPVFAAFVRFLPIAALVVAAQRRVVDPLYLDAASVFGRSRAGTFLSVHLPLLLPGISIAAAFVSAFAIGELGATLMVVPPGHSTLTIRLYNYLHYGSSESVAALGLMMTALFLGIVLAGFVLVRRRAPRGAPGSAGGPA